MTRRIVSALCGASLVLTMTAGVAFAGEFTGNGKSLHVESSKWGTGLHARSVCAFSGQEDLQFVDEQDQPLAVPQKGVPAHAQSWGQIPKEGPGGRDFLTSIGSNPGIACNPNSPAPVE